MPRLLALALAVVGTSGCYASHRREAPGAPVAPVCPAGPLPCGAADAVVPNGLCVIGGSVLAFSDEVDALGCDVAHGDATDFVGAAACGPGSGPRRYVCCGEVSNLRVTLAAGDPWMLELGAAEDGCALRTRENAVGPYEPLEPREICTDPRAWSGVPLVVRIVGAGLDPCGGASFAERCTARVEGDDVIVRPEVAPAWMDGCETTVADRVADCVVPPLAAGRHDVRDERGRRLGTVLVPDAAPPSGAERECVPVAP